MKPNIMTLIDYLISLSEDESIEVSEKAHNVLHTISENYMQNHDMKSLIDSLEDKFYSLLTRLPTIIRRSSKIFLLLSEVKSFLFHICKRNIIIKHKYMEIAKRVYPFYIF